MTYKSIVKRIKRKFQKYFTENMNFSGNCECDGSPKLPMRIKIRISQWYLWLLSKVADE